MQQKKESLNTTIESPTLSLSESFYSVQCEGVSTGCPAYFIRLRGCNLLCKSEHWVCDTIPVWTKGKIINFDKIIDDWEKEGILDWILTGRVHLIWTGGEPTLPKHQKNIVECIEYINDKYSSRVGNYYKVPIYNEIETNGTQVIEDTLFEELDQINCSVKLANSGMDYLKRFDVASLKRIMEHRNYWFKFVISQEEDIKEIDRDFIKPLKIPASRIIMMPGLDSRDNFHERTRFCLEMAKKYGYIGMTRLHISAWDATTGV